MNKVLYDLTNPQKNIWITEQYYNGNPINNICGTVYIKEKLDFQKLVQSVNILINTHDNFKIKLSTTENTVKQYFVNDLNYTVDIVDIANEDELTSYEDNFAKQILSISDNRLFEIKIFRFPNSRGGVIVKMHHLLADSWTFGLICKQIVDTYYKLLHNIEISENTYSYKDYIDKELQYMNSDSFIKDQEYWNNLFTTVPELATIPSTSYRKVSKVSCSANRKGFNIPKNIMDQINKFCKTYKISVYNFFMSIFSIYLSRVSNLDNLVIGTPILNRTNFSDKNTNGMFVSTVPFLINIENNSSFYEFTQKISKDSLSMLRHQRYPYQKLLEDLRQKDSSLPNLYSVILSYQITRTVNEYMDCATHWTFNGTVADDLQIHIVDYNNSGSLNILYDYSVPKYCERDIIDTHNRILFMIEQILANEAIPVKDIEIVTEDEKNELLYKINKPNIGFPKNKTIVDLFEEQVNETPSNIAVTLNDESLTYRNLNKKANQLARYLLNNGVKKGDVIGIRVDKSFEMIVGILAIIKAGCTYLPINISYPQERVEYMLSDSGSKFLLTVDSMVDAIITTIPKLCIDLNKTNIYSLDSTNLGISISPEDLIYIIYTSGSTGKPKGAMLCHRNVVRLFKNDSPLYDFGENDVWTMFHSVAFDFSVWEMYGALLFGGKLVLVPDKIAKDTNLFLDLLRKEHVTVLNQTPTYFYNLLATELERNDNSLSIRYIIFGGEALKPKLIQKWVIKYPNTKLINMYGITETTVHVTFKELTEKDLKSNVSNIGKPIPTLEVLILDKNLHMLPYGVPGEMCVLGQGVFKGYLNREDLNAQKLIPNSYYGETLYHSGDLAILHKDGNLEYLGRMDKQVKLRGFRVELGEIEEQILKNENIKTCIVAKKVNKNNRDILCAYYIKSANINIDSIKKSLQVDLPYYMIPQYFIEIDKVPMNINGKVDFNSLPIPDEVYHDKEIIKARNQIDNIIIKAFRKVLGIKQISIEDSFFELGGDSLSAISICTHINESTNLNISVKDILENPIIKDLSDSLIETNTSTNFDKIQHVEESEFYPISSAQKRIYYACKMSSEDSLVYNTPGAILINSILDAKKVQNCFAEIIRKQPSFRTIFILDNEEVKQKILDNVNFNIETSTNSEKNISKIINTFSKPFDLEKAPLLRVQLCYLDNEKTLLLFDSHHIVMDGTSLHILIDEFCKLYNDDTISPLSIDYKDYSIWENSLISSDKIKNIENYWINKFKGSEIPSLNLPYDYPNPTTPSFVGDRLIKNLNDELINKINILANDLQVSPYMIFISAYFILLYKYTGQNEIIVGTPFANRNISETNNIIGMFVNNLCVDAKIDSNISFVEFLNNIKEQILSDINNGIYPYDLLIKKLNIPNNTQLFNTMFTYQNTASNKFIINGKESKLIPANLNIAKFNLSFEINPNEKYFNIEYRTDLFNHNSIERLFNHYINILNNFLNNKNILIKNINMLDNSEEKYILNNFNNNKLDFPENSTLVSLFKNIVKTNGDKIAIETDNDSITYNELDKKSTALANKLIAQGLKPHEVVGVCLNRSIELLISIWAILKANCIYMPMYVGYPEDRLSYMLLNSDASLLISNTILANKIEFTKKKEILDNYKDIADYSEDLNIKYSSIDPAYIIYTSGSTGKPKGVIISNKNLINFIYNFNYLFNNKLNNNDTFLASTNISFDVSIWELFLPILNGCKLFLYSEEIIRDIIKYCNNIIKYKITGLYIPPNILDDVYNILKDSENIYINKLLVGVEPIKKSTLNNYFNLNKELQIVNGYGPTETTICSTALKYELDNSNDDIVSIGHPLSNNNAYIVNVDKQLQPIGIPGELYITGAGIGLGYINNDKENRKNYLQNIYDASSDRMYKTGDLALWLPDGKIKFIGRNDSQVKISGHRIELSEINSMIMKYPTINKSFTTIYTKNSKKYIVAYYTSNKEVPKTDLFAFLKNKLADYMVPTFLMQIDEFPLTVNGKIDKANLPTSFIVSRPKYIAPRNDFEKNLAFIWSKLLGIKKIGINDNFFEIGGDSLLAIKFQLEAVKLGLNISYSDIFTYPTIKQLSEKNNDTNNSVDISNYDYTNISNLLEKNNIKNINKINKLKSNIGNILLIGATGFLGAHILDEFLKTHTGIAYCLIREKSLTSPKERLKDTLNFYFGKKYDDYFDKRIIVITGDITNAKFTLSESELQYLAQNITTIIDSAALVKHFGSYQHFYDINVNGTNNIINFAHKYNKKLYYISTLSVSGNSFDETKEIQKFDETNFYIGQDFSNVYIHTKFEAEKLILEKIQTGLDACILRIGNITNRYSDGVFQINVSENAFVNRLKSLLAMKVIPEKLLEHSVEFTPVDTCAQSIIKIVDSNPEFTVFHLFDDNTITCKKLLEILNSIGINIKPVSDEEFKNCIDTFLNNNNLSDDISGIITDLDDNKSLNLISNVIPVSDFSKKYLNIIDFNWPMINNNYIKKYINYFINIRYFNGGKND